MNVRWKRMIGAGCWAIMVADTSNPFAHKAQAAMPGGGIVRWIGTGSQVYACKRDGERFAWVLQRPDAMLTDASGLTQGWHGAGPSWTARDGSQVFGTVMASVPAPAPGAIPWLVLRASRHVGNGFMSGVDYVLRTDTEGGSIPTEECNSSNEGGEMQKPYRATYTFLVEPDSPEAAKAVP